MLNTVINLDAEHCIYNWMKGIWSICKQIWFAVTGDKRRDPNEWEDWRENVDSLN